MNPLKCAFRIISGKFLGSIVRHRGFKLIMIRLKQSPSSASILHARSISIIRASCAYPHIHWKFMGSFKICLINVNLLPNLWKKDVTFEWDEQCQDALKVSIHILQLRLSWPAQPKENPGATYVTILDHSFGTLLAEENAEEKKMSCITTLECLWGRKKDLPASRKYAWRSYLPAKNCHYLSTITRGCAPKWILQTYLKLAHLKWPVSKLSRLKQYDF